MLDDEGLTNSVHETDTLRGPSAARILVVEDQFVGAFLRSLLAPRNYEVAFASPSVARLILQEDPGSVDVLITNAPLQFTKTPDVALLYLSSNPVPEAIQSFAHARPLTKPFHPRELFECLRELLS